MFAILLIVALVAVTNAFAPVSRVATKSSLSMRLQGVGEEIVGSDIEFPSFDPWEFSKDCDESKMFWYRSAELKHGRVAMLAALGQITQYYVQLGDPVFSNGDKPLKAMEKVFSERPLAAIQILLAIFAVEAFGQFNQVKEGAAPGDLGFDPLGLKPEDPEVWEKVQLRELKNGRLAMLAIAGMLYTELLSGNGVLEVWKIGAVSPFGDGIGIL
ncbi:chlorophyll a/b-binding protein domain-containing protein [Ochromonadaceae sp. CCMP2298]|nr:chlorophyll a/b-binding protein domain-containing protein [Ochromonadaceae sp. CCMP2298]